MIFARNLKILTRHEIVDRFLHEQSPLWILFSFGRPNVKSMLKEASIPARPDTHQGSSPPKKQKAPLRDANVFIGGDGGNRTRVQKALCMSLRNVVCFLCLSRASSETDQMLASRFPKFRL